MDGLYKSTLLIRFGNFLFRYRNLVFPVVLAPILIFDAPVGPGEDVILDRWLDIPFILVGLVGEALRVLVVGYAYIKRGGVNKSIYADRLVTRGVFGHSRNPLYVGNMLMLLSLILVADNLYGYVVCLPFFVLAYVSIVAAEEAHLRRLFGEEYEDYCRRVNRWIPNFRGFRKSIEGMRFRWGRVVVKEYTSFFAWVLGLLVIELKETVIGAAVEEHIPYLVFLGIVLALAVAAFTIARILKKSGWFRETAS